MIFKNHGILGQNSRNLNYIREYNDTFARRLADNKLKTKDFLAKKGVNVPETIATIDSIKKLDDFDIGTLNPPFVIKPNAGFGGKGILIIVEKDATGKYTTNDGNIFSKKDLKIHFENILSGFFSLSGNKDKIIIERKIEIDHDIDLLGKYGLPDIRVVVFNMVPVIAMIRIPTEDSKGKANLHAGACGAGIDIGSGKITYITRHSKIIKTIPGIGDVRGITLPNWNKILELSVKVQKATNIGYLGCDIVLDREKGPLLLEMNIRPGLEVQIANLAPLKKRLNKVVGVHVTSVEKGVRLGKDLFGGDIEEKIKNISGKKVIGQKEYINISYGEKLHKYLVDINSGNNSNYIDKSFLLDILKVSEKDIDSGSIILKFKLLGKNKILKFIIKELGGVNIILGVKSMKGFLLDPFKYKKGELPIDEEIVLSKSKNIAIIKSYKNQLKNLDKKLIDIDKKLPLINILKPKNILQEKLKFIHSMGEYIPEFKYEPLAIDLDLLEKTLNKIEIGDIPLSGIYIRKKEEIKNKIKLLKAFENQDYSEFTKSSTLIYGEILPDILSLSIEKIGKRTKIIKEKEFLTFEEIKSYIKKFNHIYGINILTLEENRISRFAIKGNKLLIRKGALVGKKEIRSIISHEIEGHYLRRLNGKKLDYKIFSHGTAGYIDVEEGIAIYNQNRSLTETNKKFYSIFERYYFVNFALTHSYSELISELAKFYENNYEDVFKFMLRLKKGFCNVSKPGCFVKDLVYANGLIEVEDFINKGGDLKDLYIGKIGIRDLEEIKGSEILKIKREELLIPFFL